MENPAAPRAFEIGLVMAGAVSAGAYTAGVMDFLLDALNTWESAKSSRDVPTHSVQIKVMTGASAGGMTTAISAVEILDRARKAGTVAQDEHRSKLYTAWVERIDIDYLLDTTDLDDGSPIKSLLDSNRIEEIAREMIDEEKPPTWVPIPYIHNELKIYLTLSNLRGLPYEFKLNGNTGLPYGMTDHSDYQYVEICENMKKSDWIKLRKAAVATGAFPVGLAGRLVERDTSEYNNRIHHDGRDLSGLLKLPSTETVAYNFVSVDGGALNNEPIELARSVWEEFSDEEKEGIKNFSDFEEAQYRMRIRAARTPHSIILIDPFPKVVSFGQNATHQDTALKKIFAPLINALLSQSLFKLEELFRAADPETNDRFLIAPVRYTETDVVAANALACGFFNGFGGFLSKDFREHDYRLGRRNCQRFLEKHFSIPLAMAKELGWSIHPDYLIKVTETDGKQSFRYPIIPVIKNSRVADEEEKSKWPDYDQSKARELKRRLNIRVKALLQKSLPLKWIDSFWVGAVIVVSILLFIFGQILVLTSYRSDGNNILAGFHAIYLYLFQLFLFVVFVILLLARLSKKIISGRLAKKIYRIIIDEVKDYGIRIKSE